MKKTTHKRGPRVAVVGDIVAAREVPDPMDPDARIWKAQVKVGTSELVDPKFGAGTNAGWDEAVAASLVDRVEITFPIKPTVGADVKFTATRVEGGEGRILSNPRGIKFRREVDASWIRIGG